MPYWRCRIISRRSGSRVPLYFGPRAPLDALVKASVKVSVYLPSKGPPEIVFYLLVFVLDDRAAGDSHTRDLVA